MKAISKVFMRALACHEALRRLGFDPADIYIGISGPTVDGAITRNGKPAGANIFVVQLKTQGKEFTLGMGEANPETYLDDWQESVRWWNTEADEKAMDIIWERFGPLGESTKFVASLIEYGFVLPRCAEERVHKTKDGRFFS